MLKDKKLLGKRNCSVRDSIKPLEMTLKVFKLFLPEKILKGFKSSGINSIRSYIFSYLISLKHIAFSSEKSIY